MSQPEPSRIRNQRVDIKVGPEVYRELTEVKALLEQVEKKKVSMQEVIGLLYDWSQPRIAEMRELHAKLDSLTTKKEPPRAKIA
jgi:hypothetical protein